MPFAPNLMVIALCSDRETDRHTNGQMDGRMDGCYQLHYLPYFAVDKYMISYHLAFGMYGQSSCHLYMVFQLLQHHGVSTVTTPGECSYKIKKGTGHVFYMAKYMATPSHATEIVWGTRCPPKNCTCSKTGIPRVLKGKKYLRLPVIHDTKCPST